MKETQNVTKVQSHVMLILPNVVTNSWVKLTLENQLARGGCTRAYKHMIKFILNPCGTLGS